MKWRIINKTVIQKVFTAMIALFLMALILFLARQYLVATICLAGFCVLFWKWRHLFIEQMLLTLLIQSAGRMRYDECGDRFPKEKLDGAIRRLSHKGAITIENDMLILKDKE
jgi:hypothetical protein